MGGVLVDPAGMDLVDRNRIEKMPFDAAVALRGHQTCFFQDVQVFRDAAKALKTSSMSTPRKYVT